MTFFIEFSELWSMVHNVTKCTYHAVWKDDGGPSGCFGELTIQSQRKMTKIINNSLEVCNCYKTIKIRMLH
jgi:hypothetical protein